MREDNLNCPFMAGLKHSTFLGTFDLVPLNREEPEPASFGGAGGAPLLGYCLQELKGEEVLHKDKWIRG